MPNYSTTDAENTAGLKTQSDMLDKNGLTKKAIVTTRIAQGKRFMGTFSYKAKRSANRYLDSSARSLNISQSVGDDGQLRDLPVGEINYMAINIRQKVAAISINRPDMVVRTKSGNSENAEAVRTTLKEQWEKKKWSRIFRRVLMSRFIEGMGFLAYVWDRTTGFEVEYLKHDRVFIDPHTTDAMWSNPRWGGYYIYLPTEIAHERYGVEAFEGADATGVQVETMNPFSGGNVMAKNAYEIAIYFDKQTQAEMFGDKVLRITKNLYGRVPILALQGDLNPDGEFGLSDYDSCLGQMEMYRRVLNIINTTAQNGGGIPWLRTEFIDEKIRQKVISGTHTGYVLVSGVPGEQALGYTANQPLQPAVLDAIKMLMQGMDSDQGVNEYDRGVIQNNPKFATQASLLANRAGARGNLSRQEFEEFVEDVLNQAVYCSAEFGLDPAQGEASDQAKVLWAALKDVAQVRIIEESMTFKDPAVQQQQSIQLLREAVATAQALQALGVMPNFKLLFDDVLRAYDRRDVDKYYITMQPAPQPGLPAQPGQPSTGQEPQPPETEDAFNAMG